MKYNRKFFEFSTLSLLEKIKVPCLVIYGDQDTVAGKKEPELLSEKIKNAVRHEIKGAGHFSFVTHSEEFNEKAIEFIESAGEND